MSSASEGKTKVAWGVVTRGAETVWSRVGTAWVGPNGSLFVRLEAFPVSGELYIKDWGPPVEVRSDPASEGLVVNGSAPSGSASCPYVPRVSSVEEPIS